MSSKQKTNKGDLKKVSGGTIGTASSTSLAGKNNPYQKPVPTSGGLQAGPQGTLPNDKGGASSSLA